MSSDRAARVVVPVRLTESLVARLDAIRGSRTRSAWIRGFIEEVVAQEERRRSRDMPHPHREAPG